MITEGSRHPKSLAHFAYCRLLSVMLVSTVTLTLWIPLGSSQTPTHSVFVEVFASSWCEPCSREEIMIRELCENKTHLAHFVVFHLQDSWSTTDAVNRATELGFNFVPSHALDGGYSRTSGDIIDTAEIESTSLRNVHLIELTVTKTIEGNILKSQVAVAERNGYPFDGEVAVYVVENNVYLGGNRWSYVYRGQAARQSLLLKPNTYQVVSGGWSIPIGVSAENLEVIAVAFDKSTVGKYGPYAVQSACSKDSSLAIPEFDRRLTLLAASTLLVGILALRVVSRKSGTTACECQRGSLGRVIIDEK
ncbi:hypothetical protein KEJ39_05085 [Candidatus Bathyarchaeota archaeon]|nr:hypothetical protein [Candidatus Bathyarchaeota archaeon]